jgi:hypothetical protein
MTRTQIMLVLDTILFLLLAMLLEPRFEGLALHEWIGLAIIPLIIVHMLFGWGWIATSMIRLFRPGMWRLRVNALLNLLLFAALVVTCFSGVMTSFVALPALGVAPHNFEGWRILHNRSEVYLEVLAALHVAMNWSWIANAVSSLARGGGNQAAVDCKAADTAPES